MSEKSKDQETVAALAQKLGLPKRVVRCKYDEHFHLIECKLTACERSWLLAEIGQLTHLRSLHLRYSKLRQIPEEIGQLVHLERLHLDHNHLEALPMSLWQYPICGIYIWTITTSQRCPPKLGTCGTYGAWN